MVRVVIKIVVYLIQFRWLCYYYYKCGGIMKAKG